MGFAILALALISGIAGWLILRKTNDRISLQIRLDQTSGHAIIQLRACLLTLEASQRRVQKARAALTLACTTNPVSCPSIKTYVESMIRVEERLQNWAKNHWNLEQLKLRSSSPPLDLDHISKQGFYEVRIHQNGLYSSAKTLKSKKPMGSTHHEWKIAWSE